MYSGGSGTAGDPYLIANLQDFKDIENNMSACFKQIADITLGVFKPIGYNGGNFAAISFTGVYDGDNYKLQDGTITYLSLDKTGIFRSISGATVKNIKLCNIKVTGYVTTGIIIGAVLNSSNIFNIHTDTNCTVNASSSYCGGITGTLESNSIMENCSNAANIIGYKNVGGITGYLSLSTIRNCYNMGHIIASGRDVGGIVGIANNDACFITNCLNRGMLRICNYSGGIVGTCGAACTCSGNFAVNSQIIRLNADYSYMGRITGQKTGILTNNYARSDMEEPYSGIYADKIAEGKDGASIDLINTRKKFNYINAGWSFTDTGGYWVIDEDNAPPKLENSFDYIIMFSGGSGTKLDPFLISNMTDFNNIQWYMSYYFKQIADLTLGIFEPIGLRWTNYYSFSGTYDGDNHIIQDGTISYSSSDRIGIFSHVSGTIKNIQLKNINVIGNKYTGILIGYSSGCYIENVHTDNECSIIGCSDYTGGIISNISSSSTGLTINACSNKATVKGTQYIGGIVGFIIYPVITNCYNEGEIYCTGTHAGGIFGYSNSYGYTLQYCYNIGNISGVDYCGGIAGATAHYIRNCYAFNDTITRLYGVAQNFGRIVGYQNPTLKGNNNYANDEMKIIVP